MNLISKLIIFIIVIAMGYCGDKPAKDSEITKLEIKEKLKFMEMNMTRPCYKNYEGGECVGLKPAATGCLWKPGDTNGWCVYKKGKTISNVFELP
jgi:hypothetical protein